MKVSLARADSGADAKLLSACPAGKMITLNVCFWHFSDLSARPLYVRYWGYFGREMLAASISHFDLGCVKTHTSEKCIKYHSAVLHRTVCAQYDLTPRRPIPSRFFYGRGGRWSFYTAKTLNGHRRLSGFVGPLTGKPGLNGLSRKRAAEA
jgi:hypothetical protein